MENKRNLKNVKQKLTFYRPRASSPLLTEVLKRNLSVGLYQPAQMKTTYSEAFVNSIIRSQQSAELVVNTLKSKMQHTQFKVDQRIHQGYARTAALAGRLNPANQPTIMRAEAVKHRAFRNKTIHVRPTRGGLKTYVSPAMTHILSAAKSVRNHKTKIAVAACLFASSKILRSLDSEAA